MPEKSVAVTTTTKDEPALQAALLKAVGFDKLGEAERELALAIARQYDLDVMLRHLVIVEGKPYITRDGLLHVAHKSGVFDGIEVEQPTLDDDKKYWRTWAKVYRKDMVRPFRYPGRYPATSGNVKYNEEMCIKVAEVMTLRRAFDVAAPVIEERWDGDAPDAETPEGPTTLAGKIAARAAALQEPEGAPETAVEAPTESDTLPPVEAPTETVEDEEPLEGEFTPISPLREPEMVVDPPMTLARFADLTRSVERTYLGQLAAEMYPNRAKFGDLNAAELTAILDRIEEDAVADALKASQAPDPEIVVGNIVLCNEESPYGDGERCTMDKDHAGPHRAGVRVSWAK